MAKKSAKKIYDRELRKALKEKTKPTKKRKEISQEHAAWAEIDKQFSDNNKE